MEDKAPPIPKKNKTRFFSRPEVQEYFLYHFEHTYHGNITATLADPGLRVTYATMESEWKKHKDRKFKERLEKIRDKFRRQKDKRWEREYQKNTRAIGQNIIDSMLAEAAKGKTVEHRKFSNVSSTIDSHLRNNYMIKKIQADIDKTVAETERIRAVTAAIKSGELSFDGNASISLNVVDAPPATPYEVVAKGKKRNA